MDIAVLLTCHNRKEKTQACLSSLYKILPECDVFLVDDGSTDGTSDMVRSIFPQACLIAGDGNLFWNRGMLLAWQEAMKKGYAYYLWLNDDVALYGNCLEELLSCLRQSKEPCIVSGLIEDKVTREILYGGSGKNKRLNPKASTPQPARYLNGNVVLVAKEIVDKIGILDPVYHHDLGDVDYGLRALENGVEVFTTREAVGYGYKNNICRVRKWGVSLTERFKRLYSPLGANPRINFYFRRKHFGLLNATAYYLFLHVLNLMPDTVVKIIWKEKYC